MGLDLYVGLVFAMMTIIKMKAKEQKKKKVKAKDIDVVQM